MRIAGPTAQPATWMLRVARESAKYLAPLLLAVVAVAQVYRAHAFDQSPWKGGGFGMFSTVDSPGARYVRSFVVTDDGEDLEVPTPLLAAATVERVKVVPAAEPLADVAELIARTRWVWADHDPMPLLPGIEGTAGADAAAPTPGAGRLDAGDARRRSSRPVDQPRLRPLQGGEPEPPPEALVAIASARVELWRITFDGASNRLRTRRLLAVTHAVEAPTAE